ncbi:hypothetical protein F4802DRAFT_445820 [Xylaria palmicola]|nr:hypothetical protein F4802DRAFT_445820 [Xylaria palmicola]
MRGRAAGTSCWAVLFLADGRCTAGGLATSGAFVRCRCGRDSDPLQRKDTSRGGGRVNTFLILVLVLGSVRVLSLAGCCCLVRCEGAGGNRRGTDVGPSDLGPWPDTAWPGTYLRQVTARYKYSHRRLLVMAGLAVTR